MSSATGSTAELLPCDHAQAHSERRSARKSALRRAFLRRIRGCPSWHDFANGPLSVGFTESDRSKGVWARTMSGLDGPVGEAVHFSTLIHSPLIFCLFSTSVSLGPPPAPRQSTSIARSTPPASESIMASIAIIPVQRARSRGHFRTSELSLRSCSSVGESLRPAGSG